MINASAAYENHIRLNVNGWNADPSSTMLVDQIKRLSYSLHNRFLVRAFRHLASEVLVELIGMPATHRATVSAAATTKTQTSHQRLASCLKAPCLCCFVGQAHISIFSSKFGTWSIQHAYTNSWQPGATDLRSSNWRLLTLLDQLLPLLV